MGKQTSGNALERAAWANPSEDEVINKARAQEVLDAWLADFDEIDREAGDEWEQRVNAVIAKNMDVDSLHYFIKIIRNNRDRAVRTALARKGADEAHKEHRSMKADAFVWLDANRAQYKSMDAAAQAITKQQPIAFRTARDWVGEWKKLRSTGTP